MKNRVENIDARNVARLLSKLGVLVRSVEIARCGLLVGKSIDAQSIAPPSYVEIKDALSGILRLPTERIVDDARMVSRARELVSSLGDVELLLGAVERLGQAGRSSLKVVNKLIGDAIELGLASESIEAMPAERLREVVDGEILALRAYVAEGIRMESVRGFRPTLRTAVSRAPLAALLYEKKLLAKFRVTR